MFVAFDFTVIRLVAIINLYVSIKALVHGAVRAVRDRTVLQYFLCICIMSVHSRARDYRGGMSSGYTFLQKDQTNIYIYIKRIIYSSY